MAKPHVTCGLAKEHFRAVLQKTRSIGNGFPNVPELGDSECTENFGIEEACEMVVGRGVEGGAVLDRLCRLTKAEHEATVQNGGLWCRSVILCSFLI